MEYLAIKNSSGETVKLPIEEFECTLVDSDERSMGEENCYELSHPDFEISCHVYEYPRGFFNYKTDWVLGDEIEILEDTINYFGFFIQE